VAGAKSVSSEVRKSCSTSCKIKWSQNGLWQLLKVVSPQKVLILKNTIGTLQKMMCDKIFAHCTFYLRGSAFIFKTNENLPCYIYHVLQTEQLFIVVRVQIGCEMCCCCGMSFCFNHSINYYSVYSNLRKRMMRNYSNIKLYHFKLWSWTNTLRFNSEWSKQH
jgi:hypothetical protein